MAIKSYKDKGSRDIAKGDASKEARRSLPVHLHSSARRKFAFIDAATSVQDLKSRPGLNFHQLTGDRIGQSAIRINDQYRICFLWNGKDCELIEITDYH